MAIFHYAEEVEDNRIRWPRVAGLSVALIVHVVMFSMLMLPPRADSKLLDDDDPTLDVVFIEPPPPPPPEPPEPPPPPPEDEPPPEEPPPEIIPDLPPPPAPPPPVISAPVTEASFAAPVAPPAPPGPPPPPDVGASLGADYQNRRGLRYPPQALRRREEGTVTLRVYVDANGDPETVELQRSSGSRNLDQAAIRAVRTWKFRPGMQDGRPVGGWVVVPIQFRLTDA